jgi:hypothetical protein
MSTNCFDQKVNLPSSKKFQINYVFEGNQIRNKFSYKEFLKCRVEFELKIEEALGFEIQLNLVEFE